jgi:hypothetical protein
MTKGVMLAPWLIYSAAMIVKFCIHQAYIIVIILINLGNLRYKDDEHYNKNII